MIEDTRILINKQCIKKDSGLDSQRARLMDTEKNKVQQK